MTKKQSSGLRHFCATAGAVAAAYPVARARAFAPLLLAALALNACVTVGAMRDLPESAGVEARYRASPDSVIRHVPGALRSIGHDEAERGVTESGGTMVIGTSGADLWSWGYHTRLLVAPEPDGTTRLAVASRSRYALDLSDRASRQALRGLRAVDVALGPERVAPFEGMVVRGTTPEGREVVGPVDRSASGGFRVLVRGDAGSAIPLTALDETAVLRGSYGHGYEGSLVGMVVGLALGFALADECGEIGCTSEAFLGAAIGSLAGLGVGSAIRTEVWSPMEYGGGPGGGVR